MALYKPSNFYPNMNEVDLEDENGAEFECKIHANGDEVNAYKLNIYTEDGVNVYEQYKNLEEPIKDGNFLKCKVEPYEINIMKNIIIKNIFEVLSEEDKESSSDPGNIMDLINFEVTNEQMIFFKFSDDFIFGDINTISQDKFVIYKIGFLCYETNDYSSDKYLAIEMSPVEFTRMKNTIKTLSELISYAISNNIPIYPSAGFKDEIEEKNFYSKVKVFNIQISYRIDDNTKKDNPPSGSDYTSLRNVINSKFEKCKIAKFQYNDKFVPSLENEIILNNLVSQKDIYEMNYDNIISSSQYNILDIIENKKSQYMKIKFYLVDENEVENLIDIQDVKSIKISDLQNKNYKFLCDSIPEYFSKIKILLKNDNNYKWGIRLYENKIEKNIGKNIFDIKDMNIIEKYCGSIYTRFVEYSFLNNILTVNYPYVDPDVPGKSKNQYIAIYPAITNLYTPNELANKTITISYEGMTSEQSNTGLLLGFFFKSSSGEKTFFTLKQETPYQSIGSYLKKTISYTFNTEYEYVSSTGTGQMLYAKDIENYCIALYSNRSGVTDSNKPSSGITDKKYNWCKYKNIQIEIGEKATQYEEYNIVNKKNDVFVCNGIVSGSTNTNFIIKKENLNNYQNILDNFNNNNFYIESIQNSNNSDFEILQQNIGKSMSGTIIKKEKTNKFITDVYLTYISTSPYNYISRSQDINSGDCIFSYRLWNCAYIYNVDTTNNKSYYYESNKINLIPLFDFSSQNGDGKYWKNKINNKIFWFQKNGIWNEENYYKINGYYLNAEYIDKEFLLFSTNFTTINKETEYILFFCSSAYSYNSEGSKFIIKIAENETVKASFTVSLDTTDSKINVYKIEKDVLKSNTSYNFLIYYKSKKYMDFKIDGIGLFENFEQGVLFYSDNIMKIKDITNLYINIYNNTNNYNNLKVKSISNDNIINIYDKSVLKQINESTDDFYYQLFYKQRNKIINILNKNDSDYLIFITEKGFISNLKDQELISIFNNDNLITYNSICVSQNEEIFVGRYIRFPDVDKKEYNITNFPSTFVNSQGELEVSSKIYGINVSESEIGFQYSSEIDGSTKKSLHQIIGVDKDNGEIRFENNLDTLLKDQDTYEIWEQVEFSGDLQKKYYTRVFPNYAENTKKTIVEDANYKCKIENSNSNSLFLQNNIAIKNDNFFEIAVQFNDKKDTIKKSIIFNNFEYLNKNYSITNIYDLYNLVYFDTIINAKIGDNYKIYSSFVDSSPESYFYAKGKSKIILKYGEYNYYLNNVQGQGHTTYDDWYNRIEDLSAQTTEIKDVYDKDVIFVAKFENDIEIKKYKYELYSSETGELLKEIDYIYGDDMHFYVRGLINNERYTLILYVETEYNGEYKEVYNFEASFSETKRGVPIIESNNSVSSLCGNEIILNYKFSSTDVLIYINDGNSKLDTFIYYKNSISATENNPKKFALLCYNLRNNCKYTLKIYRSVTSEKLSKMTFYYNDQEFKTCMSSYTLMDIIKIDDDTYESGDRWSFKYNLDAGDTTINNSIAKSDTIGKYQRLSIGKRKYESGTISCLIGDVDDCNYTEFDGNNNINKLLKCKEFISNGNLKLLKDYKGNKFIVNTAENLSYKIDTNSHGQNTTISFTWAEVMSSDNISIRDFIELTE